MNHQLTPEQRLFQSSTRAFLKDTAGGERRASHADHPGGLDRTWWRRAAELGWTSMLVDERLGGGTVSGAAMSDLSSVAVALGEVCAPGPFISTSAILEGLSVADNHDDTVASVVSGDVVVGWAHYEPDRGLYADLRTTATEIDDEFIEVSGAKDRIEAGGSAEVFLVSAVDERGLIQFLVPRDAAGLTVTETWSLDTTRTFSRIDLDRVRIRRDDIVSSGQATAASIENQVRVAAVLACAESVGAVQRMFEATMQWLTDRYTFGRPLASYQALKHRMADNKTWLEACIATTSAASDALDSDSPDAAELVAVAKAYVGEKAPIIMQDFVQLHGGLGITWEHDLHLYLRRTVCNRALFGTPEENHRTIVTAMEGRAA